MEWDVYIKVIFQLDLGKSQKNFGKSWIPFFLYTENLDFPHEKFYHRRFLRREGGVETEQ